MHRGMKNLHRLKVRQYAYCMIDLNYYLYVLPGTKESDKNCETELNEILLNSMPNNWIR